MISPTLATVAAFFVGYSGTNLIDHERVCKTAIVLLTGAFGLAAVAGLMGALIIKAAPVH